ncbi:hypothetical protein [Actinoplanes auranticolor]|uniref:DUF4760 domain-containing protein n=1 Tax=Actinoplanes auranticolor TaxID=47988 RepID=A0A919VPX6_9ACTN|nr:hypothetical protein [Actinoplanes auranticolor]GIM74319.1 hypothetical protein Aau02nite_60440 [Actinoplanes auranticolor]
MKDVGWVPQIGSWVSVLISMTALTLTGLTYRDRRKQDRRDLFLRVHERLVEPDLQRGRRLIFTRAQTVEAVIDLREHEPEIYDQINRAVAMLDIAGMYITKNYIDKDDFMAEWGPAYGRIWLAAQPFLEVRLGGIRSGGSGWPHFRLLGPEAANALEPERSPDLSGDDG